MPQPLCNHSLLFRYGLKHRIGTEGIFLHSGFTSLQGSGAPAAGSRRCMGMAQIMDGVGWQSPATAGQRADRPIRGAAPPGSYAGTMINRTPHLNFQCAVPPASLGAYLIAW